MRKVIKIWLLATILMLPATWSSAQMVLSEEQGVLSLEECIQIGLDNNYAIRIVRNQEQITDNNATRGNAGQLPSLDLGATFIGSDYNFNDRQTADGSTTSYSNRNNYVDLGLNLGWNLFEGFRLSAEYSSLKELSVIGELTTRQTIEDFVASVSSEYYSLIRQQTRLANLKASADLSRERLRIVEESYHIGAASGLDFQQAQVDYNADNSAYISQLELVRTTQINLNELMGFENVEFPVALADSVIYPNAFLDREELWGNTITNNVSLLIAQTNRTISELDLKRAQSRNYPYLRVSAGYGYRRIWDNYSGNDYQNRLGLNYGVTAGITLFDGMNRRREQRNARLDIENRDLYIEQLKLGLRSQMASFWLAYTNNLLLWEIEKDNLVVARSNFDIAMERYRLRELSGIELREAQLSLLQSEERLSIVEYNIKLSEISLYQLSGRILQYKGGSFSTNPQ